MEQVIDTFWNATTGERVDLTRKNGEYIVHFRNAETTMEFRMFNEYTARNAFHAFRKNEGRIPVDGRLKYNERTRRWEF